MVIIESQVQCLEIFQQTKPAFQRTFDVVERQRHRFDLAVFVAADAKPIKFRITAQPVSVILPVWVILLSFFHPTKYKKARRNRLGTRS